jgi:hypothetical protein
MARTGLYMCLCVQEFGTSHLPDQVQDQVAARKAMRLECRGPCTSSARYSPNPKVRYPAVQKLLYAILITLRKLRLCFDEYKINVITDISLADILHNEDATGRISKWAVELGALSIDLKPRTAIKSQALIDFIAKWRENQIPTPVDKPEHWTMYFDGSLMLDGGNTGVLFISPRGEQL